jgi:hypothetical protein
VDHRQLYLRKCATFYLVVGMGISGLKIAARMQYFYTSSRRER